MAETTEKTPRVPKATVVVNEEAQTLTFTFAHGAVHVMEVGAWDKAMRLRAMLHGAEQKGRDSYAGCESSQEAEGAFLKTLDTVKSGKWATARVAGGSWSEVDCIAEAIVRSFAAQGVEKNLAAVADKLKSLKPGERRAYTTMEAIAPFYQDVLAERGKAKKVSLDAF